MRVLPISREHLHGLVSASCDGVDASRDLLREVLPVLSDLVAAVLTEMEGVGASDQLPGIRDELLGEIAERLVKPEELERWRVVDVDCAWGFLEAWGLKTARRLRDRVWVRRAVVERISDVREALFKRLLQIFAKAANYRRLDARERDEARQSFSLWLLERDCRALRRWDPEGGRTFDSWFYARALNQIDTWRRGLPALPDPTETDPFDPSRDEERIVVRDHLKTIQRWLEERCSERQREIFTQTFIEEKAAVEIAADIGMQPGAVFVAVMRLRKAIAVLFDL